MNKKKAPGIRGLNLNYDATNDNTPAVNKRWHCEPIEAHVASVLVREGAL